MGVVGIPPLDHSLDVSPHLIYQNLIFPRVRITIIVEYSDIALLFHRSLLPRNLPYLTVRSQKKIRGTRMNFKTSVVLVALFKQYYTVTAK